MGSYADSLLSEGEVVIRRQRQHWLSLLLDSRLAIGLWAIAIVLLVLRLLANRQDDWNKVADYPALVFIVLGIIILIYRWRKWMTEEYLITNRRLLKVSGLVNKRSADSNLEKINDAILEENLLGRLLDYGDLDILTAAEVAVDRYRMLHHAKSFKKDMLQAKHQLEDGAFYQLPAPPIRGSDATAPSTGVAAVPGQAGPATARAETPDEVTAALVQLAKLRDAGTISSADYEAKKQDLLGRL